MKEIQMKRQKKSKNLTYVTYKTLRKSITKQNYVREYRYLHVTEIMCVKNISCIFKVRFLKH